MAKIRYNLTLCSECMLHHASGECGTCAWCTDEAPSEGPLPLSNLDPEERAGLALGAHEHSEHCTEEDRKEGCDCGYSEMWTYWCGGCGRYTSGNAHDAVVLTV